MKRLRVLYCDDQQKFITAFKENHGKEMDILEENNISNVLKRIAESKPDLVLLDLYHPKDNKTDFEQRKNAANEELENLNKQIEKTKDAVNATWKPLGIEILEDIRKKYNSRKLPVIIYSQRGLFLLDDDQARSVEKNDGHWLIKDEYSALTEKARIDRILSYSGKAKPVLKSYRILLIGSWTIFVIFSAIQYFELDAVWSILCGVAGGLLTTLLTRFIED